MKNFPTDATRAYLALGSNRGRRITYLQMAVRWLDDHAAIRVEAVSPVYETKAHTLDPAEEQPDFLNAVVEVTTILSAEELLSYCQVLEDRAGRQRSGERRWRPRVLDVDVLVVGQEERSTKNLILPHPRLAERRFVLHPLADIAPDLYVPRPFDATAKELLAHCPDAEYPGRTDYVLMGKD